MMVSMISLGVAMMVGALIVGVISLFYISAQNKDHEDEVAELTLKLSKKTDSQPNRLSVPDAKARQEIFKSAQDSRRKKCAEEIMAAIWKYAAYGKSKCKVDLCGFLATDSDAVVTSFSHIYHELGYRFELDDYRRILTVTWERPS